MSSDESSDSNLTFWDKTDPRLIYVKFQMIRIYDFVNRVVLTSREHIASKKMIAMLSPLIDKHLEKLAFENMKELEDYFIKHFGMVALGGLDNMYAPESRESCQDLERRFLFYLTELPKELKTWEEYMKRIDDDIPLVFVYEKMRLICKYFMRMASIRDSLWVCTPEARETASEESVAGPSRVEPVAGFSGDNPAVPSSSYDILELPSAARGLPSDNLICSASAEDILIPAESSDSTSGTDFTTGNLSSGETSGADTMAGISSELFDRMTTTQDAVSLEKTTPPESIMPDSSTTPSENESSPDEVTPSGDNSPDEVTVPESTSGNEISPVENLAQSGDVRTIFGSTYSDTSVLPEESSDSAYEPGSTSSLTSAGGDNVPRTAAFRQPRRGRPKTSRGKPVGDPSKRFTSKPNQNISPRPRTSRRTPSGDPMRKFLTQLSPRRGSPIAEGSQVSLDGKSSSESIKKKLTSSAGTTHLETCSMPVRFRRSVRISKKTATPKTATPKTAPPKTAPPKTAPPKTATTSRLKAAAATTSLQRTYADAEPGAHSSGDGLELGLSPVRPSMARTSLVEPPVLPKIIPPRRRSLVEPPAVPSIISPRRSLRDITPPGMSSIQPETSSPRSVDRDTPGTSNEAIPQSEEMQPSRRSEGATQSHIPVPVTPSTPTSSISEYITAAGDLKPATSPTRQRRSEQSSIPIPVKNIFRFYKKLLVEPSRSEPGPSQTPPRGDTEEEDESSENGTSPGPSGDNAPEKREN